MDEGPVRDVTFSPDGKTIAIGYDNNPVGGVVLWDVATHKRLAHGVLAVNDGGVRRVAFSADGQIVAAAFEIRDRGWGVVSWRMADRKRLAAHSFPAKDVFIADMIFSPDGNTVAVAASPVEIVFGAGGVELVDVAEGKRSGNSSMKIPEGRIGNLSFSPDGRIIAAGFDAMNGGGGVVLWDVATQRRWTANPLPIKVGDGMSVAFRADGRSLSVGYETHGAGNRMELWDLDLDSWQRHACKIANRNFSWNEWREYFPDEPYRRTFTELEDGPGVAETRNPPNTSSD